MNMRYDRNLSLCRRSPICPMVTAMFVAVGVLAGQPTLADIGVHILPGANDSIFPNSGTTHGWQFTVNVPIEVTHLGMYDRGLNGLAAAHPVGLWADAEGVLLAQVVLGPGADDLLFENFRFASIDDINGAAAGSGLILEPGHTYTLGMYTETMNQQDGMVIFPGFHEINPAIDYAGFGVSDVTDGLQKPTTPDPNGLHRWGPNMMFTVIPTPAGFLLFGFGILQHRRRRRTM